MDRLWQDVKYGARMLARHRGVTFVAVLTLALGRSVRTLLFQVEAHAPFTLAGVAALLAVVALAACWIPARRASRVDPMVALCYE